MLFDFYQLHDNIYKKRFNELFGEFTRSKKYETRNEIVFLLDEMLRRERITLSEYEKLNNILIETLDKDNLNKKRKRRLLSIKYNYIILIIYNIPMKLNI